MGLLPDIEDIGYKRSAVGFIALRCSEEDGEKNRRLRPENEGRRQNAVPSSQSRRGAQVASQRCPILRADNGDDNSNPRNWQGNDSGYADAVGVGEVRKTSEVSATMCQLLVRTGHFIF